MLLNDILLIRCMQIVYYFADVSRQAINIDDSKVEDIMYKNE